MCTDEQGRGEDHQPDPLDGEDRAGSAGTHQQVVGEFGGDAGGPEDREPAQGVGGGIPFRSVDGADHRPGEHGEDRADRQRGRHQQCDRAGERVAERTAIGRQPGERRHGHSAHGQGEHVDRPAGKVERQHVETERHRSQDSADDDIVDVEHSEDQQT